MSWMIRLSPTNIFSMYLRTPSWPRATSLFIAVNTTLG
jgi:hypothetical protein